jgi:hypothetical protein
MRVKTNELTGAALDWAVAKCEGVVYHGPAWTKYSTDWAQGGPIIEREKITIFQTGKDWMGYIRHDTESFAPTPLIAAMRCYVASKLGDEVEIPEELK